MSTPEPDGIAWRTSSYTTGNGNCVEVGGTPAEIRVRDTKNRAGGTLIFPQPQWQTFVTKVFGD